MRDQNNEHFPMSTTCTVKFVSQVIETSIDKCFEDPGIGVGTSVCPSISGLLQNILVQSNILILFSRFPFFV